MGRPKLNGDRWTALWIRVRIDHRDHLRQVARQLKIPISALVRIGVEKLVEDEDYLEKCVVHYRTAPEV